MTKQLNNQRSEHERLKNRRNWTQADYEFYKSFFDRLFIEDKASPMPDEDGAFIEEAFSRFQQVLNKAREDH
jgi:hypothetical protein